MSSIRVPEQRLVRITEQPNVFRQGQIIQGRIMKIYPNDRAQLQIGSQRLVAQLKASLAVGERYHFQVQNINELIELKVLGSNLKDEATQNVDELLKQLNIRSSRHTNDFVQLLLSEKIPFTKQQLQRAFAILKQVDHPQLAKQVLFEMFGRQLPITSSVFNALYIKQSTTASHAFKTLLNLLQNRAVKQNLEINLLNQLSSLLYGNKQNESFSQLMNGLNQSFSNQTLNEWLTQINENHRTVIEQVSRLLNELPSDPQKMTHSKIEQMEIMIQNLPLAKNIKQPFLTLLNQDHTLFFNFIKTLANEEMKYNFFSFSQNNTIQQQFLFHVQQFMQLSGLTYEHNLKNYFNESQPNLSHLLSQILNERANLQTNVQQFINKWSNIINENNYQLTEEQMLSFKRDLEQGVLQLLPKRTGEIVLSRLQNEQPLSQLWQTLQTLSQEKIFIQMNELLTHINKGKINQALQNVTQMSELNGLLQFLQISLEQMSHTKIQQTLKGMLLQFIQQSPANISDQAQQVLHFLNGLQLNTVHETKHYIQASIQIPGEKIYLNDDLYMDFESKKTEDRKIDTDYCRILFFLNLKNLKETVIDMNIQKRFITLTIYNDTPSLNRLAKIIEQPLQQGLEALNYELSTVQFKSLNTKVSSTQK